MPRPIARLAVSAVVASVAVAGVAAAQDGPGQPVLGDVTASRYATSLYVEVGCPSAELDCDGNVTARTTTLVRPLGGGARRRMTIDRQPFSVFATSEERVRMPMPLAVCNHLRRTGRLGVEVTLTNVTGEPRATRKSVTVRAPVRRARCRR